MHPDYTPLVTSPENIPLKPKPPHPWFTQTPPNHITTTQPRTLKARAGHWLWPNPHGQPYTVHIHNSRSQTPTLVCMRPWSVKGERKSRARVLGTQRPDTAPLLDQAAKDAARCRKRLLCHLQARAAKRARQRSA